MNKVRLVLYQKPLGTRISHADAWEIRSFSPHFVCFPEYFFVNRVLGNHGQTVHNQERQFRRMKTLSSHLETVIIGGTMPELGDDALFNTSFVYNRGKRLGSYRKINLFFAEEGKITPGNSFSVFRSYGITFGVLICADVFSDESFMEMKRMGAKIIFIPTFSPKRDESHEEKFRRDWEIYVRGAAIAEALIVKVCGVKSEYKDFLQARSLIADKNGVIYNVQPEEEEKSMIIMKEVNL